MVKPTVLVVDTDPAAREGTIETVDATLPDAAVREAGSMAAAEAVLDGVDASGTADTATDTDAQVGSVSNTGDLTGISITFSVGYSALYERGVTRIRTVFDSISTLLLYADFRTITRFVHTMGGRISKTDGFGAFVLDPAMHEPQVVGTLSRLCDARFELRAAGDGYEFRVDGLGGQPSGWQPAGI